MAIQMGLVGLYNTLLMKTPERAGTRPVNAIVVDDEPHARTHLRRHLEAQGVDVIGEAEDASGALELSENLRPDLLFLDVQMPGISGMQLAGALLQLDSPPLVVFATGYSEHATAAFEHDALDYLVKPIAPDRLAVTLVRAKQRLSDRHARRVLTARVRSKATSEGPISRLPIRGDYSVRLLRLNEIEYAAARNKRVFVRTKDGEFRTYFTLVQLESLLPHSEFFRIHDSFIVNLSLAEEILFLGNHEYELRLNSGERLPIGRTRYADFRKRFGLSNASDE